MGSFSLLSFEMSFFEGSSSIEVQTQSQLCCPWQVPPAFLCLNWQYIELEWSDKGRSKNPAGSGLVEFLIGGFEQSDLVILDLWNN